MTDASTDVGAPPADVTGTLSGRFVETCDCASLCPCWVDEDPDDGHCTGLFAWDVQEGRLSDGAGTVDVRGARIVSLSTHSGHRRHPDGERASVLYLDVTDAPDDRDRVRATLERVFSEPAGGPLADLASVMGTVHEVSPARIEISSADGRASVGEAWSVRVAATQDDAGAGPGADPAVEARGELLAFDQDDRSSGQLRPMTLENTALDKELAVVGPVTALRATRFRVLLAALPEGSTETTGRSGMTGRFSYPRRLPDGGGAGGTA